MEPKTGKRIVSKGVYATLLSKKVSLWSIGSTVKIAAICIMGGTAPLILQIRYSFWTPLAKTGAFLIACSLSFVVREIGQKMIAVSKQIDPGILLTNANTAALPAPDSLVRASSEPLQAQEGVLLRAAAEGQETPPEQLVRASVEVE